MSLKLCCEKASSIHVGFQRHHHYKLSQAKLLKAFQLFELILISVSVIKWEWEYMKSHCGTEWNQHALLSSLINISVERNMGKSALSSSVNNSVILLCSQQPVTPWGVSTVSFQTGYTLVFYYILANIVLLLFNLRYLTNIMITEY